VNPQPQKYISAHFAPDAKTRFRVRFRLWCGPTGLAIDIANGSRMECSNMNKPHGWENYLVGQDDKIAILWASRVPLRLVWDQERKDAESYPLGTALYLSEIVQQIARTSPHWKPRKKEPRPNPRKPYSFSELVSEKLIEIVWEAQQNGKYKTALRKAAAIRPSNVKECWATFQTIIRAMESAYLADFLGMEFLRKPKVQILHTGLRKIANAAGCRDITKGAFAEFLDDICPCGLKEHGGAARHLALREVRTVMIKKAKT
jgi:hypothetical protein